MNSTLGRIICGTACAMGARDVIRAGREMQSVARLDRDGLVALQIDKLNELLKHFRGVTFYRKLLDDAGVTEGGIRDMADVARIPPVSKAMISEHLSELSGRAEAYRSGSTSGSTGVNFRFFQSREMAVQRTAAVRRCLASVDVEMWGDCSVSVWGVVQRGGVKTNFVRAVKRFLLNTDVWQGVGMDDGMAVDYLRRLGKVKPRVLMGYPSYLRRLAEVGRDREIETHAPRAIICSGEAMLDTDRSLIEGYFGGPVYNRYGSCEFGIIAQQCRERGEMHIPPTRFIVERGDEGELLITDLDNRATPFIRYAVGDAGTPGWGSCSCGHYGADLLTLDGRMHDEIRTASGRMLPGQFWTIVTKTVEGIEELQLVQRSLSHFELRVKVNESYRDESAGVIQKKVCEAAGEDVRVDVVRVDEIEVTSGGKRKFIINAMEDGGVEGDGH